MSRTRPQISGGTGGAGGSASPMIVLVVIGGNGGHGEGPRIRVEHTDNFGDVGGQGRSGAWRAATGAQTFCEEYKLDSHIASILAEQGFRTVRALSTVLTIELQDVGLGIGHIAELKAALESLAYDTSIGTR
ncbi:hypothetical protein B0H11DRAFT_1918397 [Mycena galericulata]|nr:hypothetical protein B0H11DRAFT_1918397 [Mycena galericulata]